MNQKFPLLSVVSLLIRWAGWIAACVGIVLLILGLVGLFMQGGARNDSQMPPVLAFLYGILLVVVGIGAVASGEIIGVFFAIEENTRQAAKLTRVQAGNKSKAGDKPSYEGPTKMKENVRMDMLPKADESE